MVMIFLMILRLNLKQSKIVRMIQRILCYVSDEDKLLGIWSGEPCHTAKAKIGKAIIHHGSFHSLKDNRYLNDVVAVYALIIDYDVCAYIINGYIRLMGNMYDNCYAVMSQTMTAIINRVIMAQPIHLLTREKFARKKYISGVCTTTLKIIGF